MNRCDAFAREFRLSRAMAKIITPRVNGKDDGENSDQANRRWGEWEKGRAGERVNGRTGESMIRNNEREERPHESFRH